MLLQKSCLFLFISGFALGCGGSKQAAGDVSTSTSAESDEPPELSPMEPAKLSYALRGSEDDFRRCLMRSMSSRGIIATTFSVGQNGKVESARVDHSTIGNQGVEQCIIDELLTQKFSRQAQPSSNRFTFVFRLTDPIDEDERKSLLQIADKQSEALKIMPESKGTIDLHHVADIAEARYPLYAHCYRDSIRRRGESRGMVRFRLHIDKKGRVADIEDEGSVMPDPYAIDCMAEAFYLMQFDPPEGDGAVVRYTMELE